MHCSQWVPIKQCPSTPIVHTFANNIASCVTYDVSVKLFAGNAKMYTHY